MKKVLLICLCFTAFSGFCYAEETIKENNKTFKPVHLDVNGLGYDLKKQEEYQINNDVFEFKKWYVEPFQKLEPQKEPNITIE